MTRAAAVARQVGGPWPLLAAARLLCQLRSSLRRLLEAPSKQPRPKADRRACAHVPLPAGGVGLLRSGGTAPSVF